MSSAIRLTTPVADYFPPASGRYEVKPGLVRFERQPGDNDADGHVFQLDATFPRYRQAKLDARRERLGKYFQTHQLDPRVEQAVARFIVGRLVREHDGVFAFDRGTLACELTGERLGFDDRFGLQPGSGYVSSLDALASQVQEDLAVVSAGEQGRHWLSAVHLSFPNNWAAEDKIGKTFAVIHDPVAGMEQMNRQGDELVVRVMLGAADGLVRFAWGITWDNELNHHPQPPLGAGRRSAFDPLQPAAFLRVERQTLWGLADVGAALFTIRTYLYDCAAIRHDEKRRAALIAAIESMSPASLAYKGLADSREGLLRWLGGDQ